MMKICTALDQPDTCAKNWTSRQVVMKCNDRVTCSAVWKFWKWKCRGTFWRWHSLLKSCSALNEPDTWVGKLGKENDVAACAATENFLKQGWGPLALAWKIFWNWDGARLRWRGKFFETGMGPLAPLRKILWNSLLAAPRKIFWNRPLALPRKIFWNRPLAPPRKIFWNSPLAPPRKNFWNSPLALPRKNFLKQGWGRLRRCEKFLKTTPPFWRCHAPFNVEHLDSTKLARYFC